jgi:hypothetical protein
MIEAGCHCSRFLKAILGGAEVDESKPVMLVVIGQECQAVVAMLHPRLKYRQGPSEGVSLCGDRATAPHEYI